MSTLIELAYLKYEILIAQYTYIVIFDSEYRFCKYHIRINSHLPSSKYEWANSVPADFLVRTSVPAVPDGMLFVCTNSGKLWYELGTRMFAHSPGTSVVHAWYERVVAKSCERQTSGSIHSIGKHVDRQFRLHGKKAGSIKPLKERFVSFQRRKRRSPVFLIEHG